MAGIFMLNNFKHGLVDVVTLGLLSFDIYRKNFKYIVLVGLGIYIPINLVLAVMWSRIDLITALEVGDMSSLFWLLLVTGMIALVVLPLETAALTYFVKQHLNDSEVSQEGVMDATFGNWGRLFFTEAIFFSIVFLGMILILPAIIFGVMACFCLNLVVIENVSGFPAIMRSTAIVRHRWWRTLVVLLMILVSETTLKFVLIILIDIIKAIIGMLLGPENIVLQATTLVISAMIDTACMIIKMFGVLYFFNLYYTCFTD
jgi:hypothetical protein